MTEDDELEALKAKVGPRSRARIEQATANLTEEKFRVVSARYRRMSELAGEISELLAAGRVVSATPLMLEMLPLMVGEVEAAAHAGQMTLADREEDAELN